MWQRLRNPAVWTIAALLLGLALRSAHFLRCPSVWHDEAALIINVLGNDFGELFGPLHLAEAAPPLFLVLTKSLTVLLGDGELALRLLPFLASCAALVLLVPLARRLMPPAAVPWAILLFACSDRLLWHSCEAKPYAVDAFLAVLLANVWFWMVGRPIGRLLLYTLLAPLVLWLSFPGCFLFGGVLVALLPGVWRRREWGEWLAYAVLVLAVFGSFAGLVAGPVAAQRCEAMDACWVRQFPDWERPWLVPLWTVQSLLEACRYCFLPVGPALAVLALIGGIVLWRRGERASLVLLTLPIGLAVLASYLGQYPFGAVRVIIFIAPALALLIGAGTAPVQAWLSARHRAAVALLVLPLLTPLALAGRHLVDPWPRADCAGAAAHVLEHRRPGDAVVGNHWEYLYYFRDYGPSFRDGPELDEPGLGLTPVGPATYELQPRPFPTGRRLWFIWTNQDRPGGNSVLRELREGQGWRRAGEWHFQFTRVVFLQR